MIEATLYDRSAAIGSVSLARGRIRVQCDDRELEARLRSFFLLPTLEHDRSPMSELRTVTLSPGSTTHFVSRCDRLHTLDLRAVIQNR